MSLPRPAPNLQSVSPIPVADERVCFTSQESSRPLSPTTSPCRACSPRTPRTLPCPLVTCPGLLPPRRRPRHRHGVISLARRCHVELSGRIAVLYIITSTRISSALGCVTCVPRQVIMIAQLRSIEFSLYHHALGKLKYMSSPSSCSPNAQASFPSIKLTSMSRHIASANVAAGC